MKSLIVLICVSLCLVNAIETDKFGYRWHDYFDRDQRPFDSCSLVENPTRNVNPETTEANFWKSADFGVLKQWRENMEYEFQEGDSSMACTSDASGTNVMCHGKRVQMVVPSDFKTTSSGQRWGEQMSMFSAMDNNECDVHIEKKTMFLKPDSHANFYHAMCDFANLYVSLHLVDWTEILSIANPEFYFGIEHSPVDVDIRMWSHDKSFRSTFIDLYKAFSPTEPVKTVGALKGKRVCFDEMVLSVNPRGSRPNFFFNMFVPGRLGPVNDPHKSTHDVICHQSALFRGFLEFLTRQNPLLRDWTPSIASNVVKRDEPVHVVMLSRSSGTGRTSGTRKLLNEIEVRDAIRAKYPSTVVTIEIVDFDWSARMPFTEQANKVMHADVLLSMHGAGLAHLMFLPRWGSVIELFNCDDHWCYSDLSRLSGVEYFRGISDNFERFQPTVEVRESSKANIKFLDYKVDVDAATKLIEDAIAAAVSHPLYPKDNERHHHLQTKDEL